MQNTLSIPGLNDNNVEFFTDDNQLFALHNGEKKTIDQLPRNLKKFLWEVVKVDVQAVDMLLKNGIRSTQEVIETYIRCKWGHFDLEPDIKEGAVGAFENHHCEHYEKCPLQDLGCGTLKAPHGILSKRMIEITRLISEGLLTKEIADRLSISINTVKNIKAEIFKRTGSTTNVELTKFAFHKNL